jgi:hypothetical protein
MLGLTERPPPASRMSTAAKAKADALLERMLMLLRYLV